MPMTSDDISTPPPPDVKEPTNPQRTFFALEMASSKVTGNVLRQKQRGHGELKNAVDFQGIQLFVRNPYLEPDWPSFWLEKTMFWRGQGQKQRKNCLKQVPGICTHFFHYMYIRFYKYVSSHPPLVHGISDYNSFWPCQWMPMVKGLTLHHWYLSKHYKNIYIYILEAKQKGAQS